MRGSKISPHPEERPMGRVTKGEARVAGPPAPGLDSPPRPRAQGFAMFTTRPEIIGTFGVVASTHWLASAAGMAILEQGGNAFDAAVAMGFALQVVEPHYNGPGGEVPILLHDRRRDGVEVVCGQGVAPAAATIGRFRELGLDLVPGSGLLAAVVPGAVDAWLLLLRDYGTLSLPKVM